MSEPIEIFRKLCTIPRESGHEKGVADWLEEFARERSLGFYRDSMENVLISRAGKGRGVILQGHSDMVCEKNDGVRHDFTRDPISVILKEGHLLCADGTTLGADDGISIAVMLAILDNPEITLPVECLVTSQEEIGLLGINSFDFSLLRGRRMINLDSMDEGVATVSCCGGVRTDFTIPAVKSESADSGYTLRIRGLAGGHSGEDINLGRRNAILTALEILGKADGVRISSIDGGSKENAIPRECTVTFTTPDSMVQEKLAAAAEAVRASLTAQDSAFTATLEADSVSEAFAPELTSELQEIIAGVPHGVIRMDPDIAGLVQTSANHGVIRTTANGIELTVDSRSSSEEMIDELISTADRVAAEHGATAAHRSRYCGWNFDRDSELRELYLRTYDSLFRHLGKKARYEGIHAGLECGIVKAAIPDMDIISLGADIKACHSPDETLDLDSLDRLYQTVAGMLIQMAE